MNTRLQVEHPVTELITGTDLVREMVRVAAGESLGFSQSDIVRRGAAIECRIYAEDPATGFLPSPGKITRLRTPAGPGIRDDSGAYEGSVISPNYDPLISKLCVWAPDRARAVARMRRAIAEYVVSGIKTNLPFHERLFEHPEFIAGKYDTGFIDRHKAALLEGSLLDPNDYGSLAAAIAVATYRSEKAKTTNGKPGTKKSGLSPWVAAHRAHLNRR
jgi:acetyl-CoA carboxylase biotin carboxylase subunit